jgi:hypothetical protein
LKGESLLDNLEMVDKHFVNDSLLALRANQDSVVAARVCLSVFCEALGVIFVIIRHSIGLLVLISRLYGFQQHGILFFSMLLLGILASCLVWVFPWLPCGFRV